MFHNPHVLGMLWPQFMPEHLHCHPCRWLQTTLHGQEVLQRSATLALEVGAPPCLQSHQKPAMLERTSMVLKAALLVVLVVIKPIQLLCAFIWHSSTVRCAIKADMAMCHLVQEQTSTFLYNHTEYRGFDQSQLLYQTIGYGCFSVLVSQAALNSRFD